MRPIDTNTRTGERWFASVSALMAIIVSAVFLTVSAGPERTASMAMASIEVERVDTTGTAAADSVRTSSRKESVRHLATGEASYYGKGFAGRPTANGETFNPANMTCAHRTLPFGTNLRVTNVRNGKSVVVRVNDRGPYAGHRILDLSQGAAETIGMIASGTAMVQIEVLA